MVARVENYQTVLTRKNTQITVFDYNAIDGTVDTDGDGLPDGDGDVVNVLLNGLVIAADVELTEEGAPISFDLKPGQNVLEIEGVDEGDIGGVTAGVRFIADQVLVGAPAFSNLLSVGQKVTHTIGLPKIQLRGNVSPFASQNVVDTLEKRNGQSGLILTLDRDNRSIRDDRSEANIQAYIEENGLYPNGFQADEVPPASTLESANAGSEVRAIPGGDNQSAGGFYQQFINNYSAPGIRIDDGENIDFTTSIPDFESESSNSKIVPIFGTNRNDDDFDPLLVGSLGIDDLIYGLDGDDIIRGEGTKGPGTPFGGDDILLGGHGNDRIGGKGGNDTLLGQADDDLLFGDSGNDLVYGGPGNDALYGDDGNQNLGRDWFGLRRGEGTDLLADFARGTDKIALLDGLTTRSLTLEPIQAGVITTTGEPIGTLDYPGPVFGISTGTRISLGSGDNREILAYVSGALPVELNIPGDSSFRQFMGRTLPSVEQLASMT